MKKKPDILVVLAVILGLGIILSSVEIGQKENTSIASKEAIKSDLQQMPLEQQKQAAQRGKGQKQLVTTTIE